QPRLLYQLASDPALSPDGRSVAFIHHTFESGREGRHELWIGNVNGDTPRKLAAVAEAEKLAGPTWSPDGQWIAYGRAWKTAQGSWSSAIEVRPLTGGPGKTLVEESSLPKSSTLVNADDDQADFTQIWVPDGYLAFAVIRRSEHKVENSLWKV